MRSSGVVRLSMPTSFILYVILRSFPFPLLIMAPGILVNGDTPNGVGHVDTLTPHDHVHFDPRLQPKRYQIKGTAADSQILIKDVKILDSTGRAPYRGDVLVEGKYVQH